VVGQRRLEAAMSLGGPELVDEHASGHDDAVGEQRSGGESLTGREDPFEGVLDEVVDRSWGRAPHKQPTQDWFELGDLVAGVV